MQRSEEERLSHPRTRQQLGMTYVKMFKNASREDRDRICLAFGLFRNAGSSMTEMCAHLEVYGFIGMNVDMKKALSIFYDIYRPAYEELANYMGVSIAEIATAYPYSSSVSSTPSSIVYQENNLTFSKP